MVIVDTTVWVDYFRGARNPETEWLDQEAVTDLILCEVLQGVRSDSEFIDVRAELMTGDCGGPKL